MDRPMGVAANSETSAGWHRAQGSAPPAGGTAISAMTARKGKQAFRTPARVGDMNALAPPFLVKLARFHEVFANGLTHPGFCPAIAPPRR
jgi:hypothetical protein